MRYQCIYAVTSQQWGGVLPEENHLKLWDVNVVQALTRRMLKLYLELMLVYDVANTASSGVPVGALQGCAGGSC